MSFSVLKHPCFCFGTSFSALSCFVPCPVLVFVCPGPSHPKFWLSQPVPSLGKIFSLSRCPEKFHCPVPLETLVQILLQRTNACSPYDSPDIKQEITNMNFQEFCEKWVLFLGLLLNFVEQVFFFKFVKKIIAKYFITQLRIILLV